MTAPIAPLDVQIAAAARELAMRKAAYPRWVHAGKMSAAKAGAEIHAMESILATLHGLQARGGGA